MVVILSLEGTGPICRPEFCNIVPIFGDTRRTRGHQPLQPHLEHFWFTFCFFGTCSLGTSALNWGEKKNTDQRWTRSFGLTSHSTWSSYLTFHQARGIKDFDTTYLSHTVRSQTGLSQEILPHKHEAFKNNLDWRQEKPARRVFGETLNLFILFTEGWSLEGLPTHHVVFNDAALTAAYLNEALHEQEHTSATLFLWLPLLHCASCWHFTLKSGSVR